VDGIESISQNFFGNKEMTQIRSAIVPASVASAEIVNGYVLVPVLAVLNGYAPTAGEKHTIASIASGQNAIEHIRSQGNQIHQVFWGANTHNISGFICWQLR